MATILDKIVATKRQEIARAKAFQALGAWIVTIAAHVQARVTGC